MNFTALCLGVLALSAVLATGLSAKRSQTLMAKIAEHRLRRQAKPSTNLQWWQRKGIEECRKRPVSITVTACGVAHLERVYTCEGLCNSETVYRDEAEDSVTTVSKCRCCFVKDGSIKWKEKTYPGCAQTVSIPEDLTCECNTCLRQREIRDGAPFSSA